MEITISMAVSVDGFIAKLDGDSDWVLDDELFKKTVNEYGCVALGRTTYEQYMSEIYPMEGVQHIVLSHEPQDTEHQNVHFVQSAEAALAKVAELGFGKLLVIGGGKTNTAFMQTGQVTKLFLDVHPLALGTGIPLFAGLEAPVALELESTQTYPAGFTQNRYGVKAAQA